MPRRGADAGSQRCEYRVEPFHNLLLSADHQAVAPLQPPDAAARSDVEIVDALFPQLSGTEEIVMVV